MNATNGYRKMKLRNVTWRRKNDWKNCCCEIDYEMCCERS